MEIKSFGLEDTVFCGDSGNYRGGMLEGIAHYHPELQPAGVVS